jgi:hypothetical protein
MPINQNPDVVLRGQHADTLLEHPTYKALLNEIRVRAFDLWSDAPFGAAGDADRQQAQALKMAAELLDAIPKNWAAEARAALRLRDDPSS